jgi:hypothetical protein
MAISSRRAGAARLRTAVDAYRVEQKDKLDKDELALLDRLAGSADAAKAFERLKLTDDTHSLWFPNQRADAAILQACIRAMKIVRSFPAFISAEQKTEQKTPERLKRLKRLDKAIAELRSFVAEETSPLLWLKLGDGNNSAFEQIIRGLDLIAEVIEWQRRGVKSAASMPLPIWLGVTRKKGHGEAANNAAIWHLALSMHFGLGKPHRREVAELAKVTLRTDVDIDRVDRVVRVRRQRRRSVEK